MNELVSIQKMIPADVENERAKQEEEDRRRATDELHVADIDGGVFLGLQKIGVGDFDAHNIIAAVKAGDIKNLEIIY